MINVELTAIEASLVKSSINFMINLYDKSGLTIPDSDGKELNSILHKIDEAYKKTYERVV